MTQQGSVNPPGASPTTWTVGPIAYLLIVLPLAKVARAIELAVRNDSLRPALLIPVSLGQDLVLVAAVALLAHALMRLHRPKLHATVILALLIAIALLLPSDVLAYKLTGRPITAHRLMGGEGATLADSNLLDRADLFGVLGGMALGLLLLIPALRFGPRIGWLRRFSRPRIQLVMLLLGCAIAALQTQFVPRAVELADQPVFVLAGSLFERATLAPHALDARRFRELLEPGVPVTPPARVPPRPSAPPKNVVIFLGEGIPFKATGFDPRFKGAINPTPNLTRRFEQGGFLFDHYYANWHASIQAIFSIVCSMFPPMSGDIVRIKPRIDCGEFSEVLQARGVTPGLFHSGQFNFYNKLALLGRRAYAIELDASELAKTSARKTHEWGIDDRAMVEGTLQWVDSLPKDQRFAALMISISPHYPYWLPPDFERPFDQDSREHQFLNGVTFLDQAFEELLRGFEARGLYDDTLFIWLGDHGHYVGEPERETPGLRQFYEPNLHTALVMLNPRMFPPSLPRSERISSRLGSHIDLLPTILDALGLPSEPRHQGQSLLSDNFEARRAFIGATDGHYIGFLEGDSKFIARTQRAGTEYYHLAKDPEELHNLSKQYPERMKRYTAQALSFAAASEALIAEAPLLRENVSVSKIYELFMQHVRVRAGDPTSPDTLCTGDGTVQCPGLGPILHVDTQRIQGDQRRCVFARVPATGSLELTIDDPDTAQLMTGTTVALPLRKPSRSVDVAVSIDGVEMPMQTLTARDAIRPRHPRAEREVRLRFSQRPTRRNPYARDGGVTQDAVEICVQLTNLFSR